MAPVAKRAERPNRGVSGASQGDLDDLNRLAGATKARAVAQRTLEQRAGELVLDRLLESSRDTLSSCVVRGASAESEVRDAPRKVLWALPAPAMTVPAVPAPTSTALAADREPSSSPRARRAVLAAGILAVVLISGTATAFALLHPAASPPAATRNAAAVTAPVQARAVPAAAKPATAAALPSMHVEAVDPPLTALEPAAMASAPALHPDRRAHAILAASDAERSLRPRSARVVDRAPDQPVREPADHALAALTAADSTTGDVGAGAAEDPRAPGEVAPSAEEDDPGAKPAAGSIDELLDEGADDMAIVPARAASRPTKKELSRSDIKAGMQHVGPRVLTCAARVGRAGTLLVNVTALPSGKVSKVTLRGGDAEAALESCVAAAVQSVQFPAFDGRPTSFTYPFLLKR